MKKIILIGGAALLLIIAFYSFSVYNRLVTLGENTTAKWQQVEIVYQRRFDLIPNLVESVKGVMNQEQAIFTALAEARTQYAGAQTSDEKAVAANRVESALGRLLAIVENYPQLKSSDNVQTLMVQIEGTENRIATERQRFNESVQVYNLVVKRVPSSIIAGIFGFDEKAYFEAAEGAEVAPKVDFAS